VEVVTVALDTGGADATRRWIEAAHPTHPSLIDQAHVTDERFGFVNVPNAVWIDEQGVIVRPAHAAHVRQSARRDMEVPEGLGRIGEMLTEVKKIRTDVDLYLEAIRDWAANGSASRFALSPDEVIARSDPRPPAHAEAAACFELGQGLWRDGEHDAAVGWFRRAHELYPENWTYKRQAWTFATTAPGEPSDLIQGPNDDYEGNWLDDVRAVGAEHYYEPFEP
jgi:tetratricopeptide (TPR) repeat protein